MAIGLSKSLASMRATAGVESPTARGQALAMPIDTKGMSRSAAWAWFPAGYAAAERGDFVERAVARWLASHGPAG